MAVPDQLRSRSLSCGKLSLVIVLIWGAATVLGARKDSSRER